MKQIFSSRKLFLKLCCFSFVLVWFSLILTQCKKLEIENEAEASSSAGVTKVAKFVVSFNLNSGQGTSPPTQIIKQGDKAVKPSPDPIKEGLFFAGWFTEKEAINKFDFDATPISASIILYAGWAEVLYTVSYNINGGEGPMPTEEKVGSGKKATTPSINPTKKGNDIFAGWFTEQKATNKFDFATLINSDITLYAGYAPKVTVTFNVNGGNAETTPLPQDIAQGNKAKKPADPTKTNDVFKGWYTDATTTKETKFDFATEITADITLYAGWGAKKVIFNVNGGNAESAPPVQNIEEGGKANKPTQDPTRAGYTFDGWFKEKEAINKFDFETETITANTTLYAGWLTAKHTVSFNLNGANGNIPDQTIESGSKAKKPDTDPTRVGYTFDGWFKEKEAINKFDFTTETITANTTLYAGWRGIFVAVGAQGSVATSANGGMTWSDIQQVNSEYTGTLNAITYGNGMFVAVGRVANNMNAFYSADGTSWTASSAIVTTNLQGVSYGNSIFVALSTSAGRVIVSTNNGVSWMQKSLVAPNNTKTLNGITYGNGTFVAVGNAGAILTSTDGSAWTAYDFSNSVNLRSVTYANGKYVAVGDGGVILTSTNGSAWTQSTSNTDKQLKGISYNNGTFVAVGVTVILTSTDGSNWQAQTRTETLNSVKYGAGTFIAVGNVKTILTSTEYGATWTSQTVNGMSISLFGVIYQE